MLTQRGCCLAGSEGRHPVVSGRAVRKRNRPINIGNLGYTMLIGAEKYPSSVPEIPTARWASE